MKQEGKLEVKLIDITANAEKKIVEFARICYDSSSSPKRNDDDLIKLLWKSGHLSVFEHGVASFRVSGVSRACTHQLVRNRIGFSYSQRSQRYVDEAGFTRVIPESIKKSDHCCKLYTNLMDEIERVYSTLLGYDIPKQDARFVLPNACTSEISVTANFRALFNFFDQRISSKAQWEIKNLAIEMLRLVYKEYPLIFAKYREFL